MALTTETEMAIERDFDHLLTRVFDVVKETLTDAPDFLPFGVRLDTKGNPALVLMDMDAIASPSSEGLLNEIVETFRQESENLRAIATCASVTVGEDDAIVVQFEHRDGGPSPLLLRKLTLNRPGRKPTFEDSQAQEAERRVWR